MSLARTNPIALEVVGDPLLPDNEEAIVELHDLIKEADDARSDWVQKQERLLRQRRGIRKKKNFPWPGANNDNWPLTDKIIRRWKPGISNLVLGADPVSHFIPLKPNAVDVARPAEQFYHWMFFHIDGVVETVNELADTVAQFGLAYTKQGWDYRTERVARIVRVNSLFPGGVSAATAAFNQQVNAQRDAIAAGVQAGQLPTDALQQVPQPLTESEFVVQRLSEQYGLSIQDPVEGPMLRRAVQGIINGAENVRLVYQTVQKDHPSWQVLNPLDVIVPPRMRSIEDAEFIAIIHKLDVDDMRRMAIDGHFVAAQVEKIADRLESRVTGSRDDDISPLASNNRSIIRDVLDRVEGVQPARADKEDTETVIECYCKLDIDGDGIREKVVLWYHPDTLTVLAMFRYPYPFEEWPIVRFEFEKTSSRPLQSRGIGELVSTFQKEKNRMHNARLDAIQVTLAPIYELRNTAANSRRNIRMMPGAIIPVAQVGDLQRVDNSGSELLGYLQEENVTDQQAETYVGIFDPGVLAQSTTERRTATEVSAVTSQVETVFGGDAQLFQSAMQRVHRQLWYLWLDLGPEEVYINVTGEEQPLLIRKADIDKDFDIVPAGTPANTNRTLAQQRALQMLQFFINDQTGLINKRRLYKAYFDTVDHTLGRLILRSEQEAALIQRAQALMQATEGEAPDAP